MKFFSISFRVSSSWPMANLNFLAKTSRVSEITGSLVIPMISCSYTNLRQAEGLPPNSSAETKIFESIATRARSFFPTIFLENLIDVFLAFNPHFLTDFLAIGENIVPPAPIVYFFDYCLANEITSGSIFLFGHRIHLLD